MQDWRDSSLDSLQNGWTENKENIAKDRKVIPDPIDDRKFQEWKEVEEMSSCNVETLTMERLMIWDVIPGEPLIKG